MRVLILCTGNSCRSQMAHGFLQSFCKDLQVHSAGTKPAVQVNPLAVQVMQEAGIDISAHYPKSVDKYLADEWDFVITVCGGANESCPAFTGKVGNRLHIGFDDPSLTTGPQEFIISEFRRVRDEIKEKFLEFYRTHIKGLTVLYFGSFNPFHIGHAAVAKHVAGLRWVTELWFVLSPKNPIKESNTLQDANQRWEDLLRVVGKLKASCSEENSDGKREHHPEASFYACDIEFHLEPPLYTYNTLEKLSALYPDRDFALLMGGDNINILHKWYRGKEIMAKYPVLVYPRQGVDTRALCKENGAIYIDAPQVDISSTQIRNMMQRGEDVSELKY